MAERMPLLRRNTMPLRTASICGLVLATTLFGIFYRPCVPSVDDVESHHDLVRTGWDRYLARIYPDFDARRVTYPLELTRFATFDVTALRLSGVRVRVNTNEECACARRRGVVVSRGRAHSGWTDAECVAWAFGSVAHTPANALVEVTHCAETASMGGRWFYATPGSGLFLHVGRTIAFESHHDAVATILNVSKRCFECDAYYPALARAARARGYDTVQFLRHSDQRCGAMAVEILQVNNASDPCATLRRGWNATMPCDCGMTNTNPSCLTCATQ